MKKITDNYTWPLMRDTVTKQDRKKASNFILNSSRLTQGKEVAKFEKQWNEWLGSKHSLFVSSGSAANLLLVSAWKELHDIPDYSKVIVPACTWVTNVSPIIQCNLEPIFCDINLDDFSFDIERLKKLRNRYGNDIRAIFVTHLLGYPAEINKFKEIFPDVHILEDVCESHGAVLSNGNKAGTYDVGGTFSFYFGHHMTTIEGGMVSTNDSELYDLMRMKRSHGLARESTKFEAYKKKYRDVDPQFLFVTEGYNFRNTDLSAIIGQSQLERLDEMIDIRNENYEYYYELVTKHSIMFVPPTNKPGISSFCFPLVSRDRVFHARLKKLLKEYHVEYRPIVSGNLLRQPFLAQYSAECVNADIAHERGLYIGNNHFVNKENFEILDEILTQVRMEKMHWPDGTPEIPEIPNHEH
jgi:CDP-4-dehydro-6-deoxyglucose reductase, E1